MVIYPARALLGADPAAFTVLVPDGIDPSLGADRQVGAEYQAVVASGAGAATVAAGASGQGLVAAEPGLTSPSARGRLSYQHRPLLARTAREIVGADPGGRTGSELPVLPRQLMPAQQQRAGCARPRSHPPGRGSPKIPPGRCPRRRTPRADWYGPGCPLSAGAPALAPASQVVQLRLLADREHHRLSRGLEFAAGHWHRPGPAAVICRPGSSGSVAFHAPFPGPPARRPGRSGSENHPLALGLAISAGWAGICSRLRR